MPSSGEAQRDLTVKVGRLLVSAAASAVLVGGRRGHRPLAAEVALLLLGGNALHTHTRDVVRAAIRAEAASFQEDARTALAGSYFQLVALGCQPAALGLHVYLARRRLRPPFEKQLIRVAKVRLGGSPASSEIQWTRGKGVIGRCWETGTAVLLDSSAAYRPYERATEEEWGRVPESIRLGLSLSEFRRVGLKYSAVAAVPIRDQHEQVRGCLVGEVLAPASGAILLTDDAQRSLADAAVVVGNALSNVPTWVYR